MLLWSRCASLLTDITPRMLRTSVLIAATVSMGFMQNQIFDTAAGYPWSLCVGDVDANLAELRCVAVPAHDVVTLRIQTLVQLGYNPSLLREGITRLSGARWSTNFQEQGHASASLLHRNHKQLGNNLLLARAQLHMLRALVTPVIDLMKQETRVAHRIQKLASQQGKRITGRHIFFKDVLAVAKEHATMDTHNNSFLHLQMKEHARLWRSLPQADKDFYETKAAQVQLQKEQHLQEEIRSISTTTTSLSSTADMDLHEEQMLTLRNCTWTLDDVVAFRAFFESSDFSHRAVDDLRSAALEPPTAPSPYLQGLLSNADVHLPPRPPCPPSWMKAVSRHRDSFVGTIFAVVHNDSEWYGLFLYARESLHSSCLSALSTSHSMQHPLCVRIFSAAGSLGSSRPHPWTLSAT